MLGVNTNNFFKGYSLFQNVHSSAESAAQCSKEIVSGASGKATEMVQNAVQKIIDWKACHFEMLPSWMRY